MGGNQSITEAPVFEPILHSLGKPLTVTQLWALPIPQFARGIDLKDVAILFRLDQDRDGIFSASDVISFAEMVNAEARDVSEQYLGERILGRCGFELIENLQSEGEIQRMSLITSFPMYSCSRCE